jgi:hypothetical protein
MMQINIRLNSCKLKACHHLSKDDFHNCIAYQMIGCEAILRINFILFKVIQ